MGTSEPEGNWCPLRALAILGSLNFFLHFHNDAYDGID